LFKGENILCISSIDWGFNWQGHQEIMASFARNGNRVLYIENTGIRIPHWKDLPRLRTRISNWRKGIRGIRKVQDNLYVFSPIVFPFPFSRIAGLINRRILLFELRQWMRAMSFNAPVVWTFLPTRTAVDLITHLDKKLVVYYCIADFEKLVAKPHKIRRMEEKLLKLCDVVFAQGEDLKQRCEFHHTPVFLFPFGVNSEVFLSAEQTPSVPEDLVPLRRPIVGYCGGLHRHVDYGLVRELAVRHPNWSFVFLGPIQTDISVIESVQNIFFLGEKAHSELPYYIKNFDVCLVPYLLSEYTSTVYPTKMNEYLILGKPVVSTNLPEVRNFNTRFQNVIRVGRDHDEFERAILTSISEEDGRQKAMRQEIALSQSWEKRIEEMSLILEKEIAHKNRVREEMWRESFLHFLKASQRTLMRWVLPALLSYVFIFYTPLLWFLARPLKIFEQPQKADAIVVLGAGVGETGNPGKSTIERARYAAQLYKDGWAPYMIFSTGYVWSFQEAEDMKLIATSSGVPKEAVLLETKSSSTYENVRFVKEMLDRKRWRSILLVSAPYHMRRVSLVFKKVAPDIEVHYLPVQKCDFYQRGNPLELRQIQALLHEGVGILYYWWKGYV